MDYRFLLATFVSPVKRLLIIAALFAATSAPASAQLTSDLTTIYAGQPITFNYTIPPGSIAPPTQVSGNGYTETTYVNFIGSVFFSGDGQEQLGSGSGSFTFTYLTPGDYVASVSVLVYEVSTICYSAGGCFNIPANGPVLGASEDITVLAAVPEPSTWAMVLLGFAGIGLLACREEARRRARHRVWSLAQ
jgi:PEP-CTERM motif